MCNLISSENLTFHEKLGSGQFGEVFKGIYKNNVKIIFFNLSINSFKT
jgi:hypothetical protein